MSSALRSTLDEDAVWAATDRERSSLADLLDDLREEEWEAPSLCAGWRVREVAAHLALAHTGSGAALAEMVRARGSFDRMIRDTALRHAAAPPAQLTGEIRAMVGSRRRAPGITHLEPLIDVLVHGQDIAVPLGRERPVPVGPAVAAATRVWTTPWPLSTAFHCRRRLRGLELVATDAGWRAGAGERVEGPIEALLLLLTGRTAAALPRLTGPGADRLRAPADEL
jgi:uncharacterized protein (TIGR03083 family)